LPEAARKVVEELTKKIILTSAVSKTKGNRQQKLGKENLGHQDSTSLKHMRILKTAIMHTKCIRPSPATLVEFMETLRSTRRWKWSTTSTNLGNLLGAWRNATTYCSELQSTDLTEATVYKNALSLAKRNANEEKAAQPLAATWKDVRKAMKIALKNGWRDAATALYITWMTAARVGCVMRLHVSDITTHKMVNKVVDSVGFFREGRRRRAEERFTCTRTWSATETWCRRTSPSDR
jgi:hypothetical protein